MKSIVFICTANICRSAMAEGIASAHYGKSGQYHFSSMGTQGLVGHSADPTAVAVCAEIGVDISHHRARALNLTELIEADMVLTMEQKHLRYLTLLSPMLKENSYCITDVPRPRLLKKDIWDPYGKPLAKFRKNRTLIEENLKRIFEDKH